MNKVYAPEHLKFLKKNIKGRSLADLTKLFNKRFRMSQTPTSIKAFCQRYGLKSGYRHWPAWNKKYYEKHVSFLKKYVPGRHYPEVVERFNSLFGFSITEKQLVSLCKRYGIGTGFTGRFPKGNVPFNKGRKGYCSPGSEKGWFRPGHPGYKWKEMPIGSERITADGYVEIKYSDRSGPPGKRWKSKHAMIWEKKHGTAPKGHAVIFLDGNKRNFALNNLQLVSCAELRVMNHQGLISNKSDLTKAGHTLAAVKLAIGRLKRKSFKAKKGRKMFFRDNHGYKLYVARGEGRQKNRWVAVRETANGPRRLKARLKARASFYQAQRELYEYAEQRGWMRIWDL